MPSRLAAPLGVFAALLILWDVSITVFEIPAFLLPTVGAVAKSLLSDGLSLLMAGFSTLWVAWQALFYAVLSGILLALAFSLSSIVEKSLYPYAVILQVTPIVSIAPLILIWVGIDNTDRALIIIAWLAAFFPILGNMNAGLRAVEPALVDVFHIYKASPWQRFWYLACPTAMPYLLAGIKVSAGLALIGAVVAEFVAGSGGVTGLAWRILEAGNRLQVAKMFSGLFILATLGVTQYYIIAALEHFIMRRFMGQGTP